MKALYTYELAAAVLVGTAMLMKTLHHSFMPQCHCSKMQCRKDKALRAHLTEKQIDKMVIDSFPASDPPSTY
jgi:hypothetical protein